MRHPAGISAISVATALGLACAPGDDAEIGELRWSGDFVEVWTSDDSLQACGGTFEYLDRHAGQIIELADGYGLPRNDYSRYFWLTEDDWDAMDRGEDVGGITNNARDVYSPSIPLAHELTHAFLGSEWLHPLFSEGTAEMWGDDKIVPFPVRLNVPEVLRDPSYRPQGGEAYAGAGFLARYLYEQGGPDALRAMVDTRRGMVFDEIAEVFKSHDLDFEALVEGYEAPDDEYIPECERDGFRIELADCSYEPTPWAEENLWQTRVDASCEAEDAVDPVRGFFTVYAWTVRTFEVTVPGTHELTWTPAEAPEIYVRLGRCDRGMCEPSEHLYPGMTFIGSTGGTTYMDLPEGKYWLKILWPRDAPPVDLSFEMRRAPVPW